MERSIRGWAARLAFSFLALAIACGYHGWQLRRHGQPSHGSTFLALAVVCLGAGGVGMNARHRRSYDPDRSE